MEINIDRNANQPIDPPKNDFKYVDQGNYVTVPLGNSENISYLYSDSATSCIITIAVGLLDDGQTRGISLAHLDSPECIQSFFSILESNYRREIYFYAQGANPSDNQTSQENAQALQECLNNIGSLIEETYLFLLEGNPTEDNRGDWGVNFLDQENIIVTNQPYTLQLADRDPTCGAQSLYCIMRRQEQPPVQLRNALIPFTFKEVIELVDLASTYQKDPNDPQTAFTNIINLQNEAIRNMWSTTPEYEAEWFSDELKQAACFTLNMIGNMAMCKHYLLEH